MANVVFIQLPEMGHINPSIKLALGLKGRGHRVSYVGPPDLRDYVGAQGLDFITVLEAACPKGFLQQNAARRQSGYEWIVELARAAAPEFYEILARMRPDLLVVDVELRGVLPLAQSLGLPCVLISTNLKNAKFDEAEDVPSTGLPVIVLCPRELEFPDAQRQRGRYYVEASIELERREPRRFDWGGLDGERPLIYCALGSHSRDYEESKSFFQAVIDAVRERPDRQLLLATAGLHGRPLDFRGVPPNVRVVNWAPQLEVLKRASLAMTHGGLGTIKECVYFEVPMIVFPAKFDQPDNAARVAFHGLGVCASLDDTSARRIQSLIRSVEQNPSIRAKLAAMGERFREIEQSGRGLRIVELILDWLRENGAAAYARLAATQPDAFHRTLSAGWSD